MNRGAREVYASPPKPRALAVRDTEDAWTIACQGAIRMGAGPDEFDELAREMLSEHGRQCVAVVTNAWRKRLMGNDRTPIRELLAPLLGPADYASGDARRTGEGAA